MILTFMRCVFVGSSPPIVATQTVENGSGAVKGKIRKGKPMSLA